MLAVQIKLKEAQNFKQFLMKNNLFNKDFQPLKEKNFVYFPLIRLDKNQLKDLERKLRLEIINKKLIKIPKLPTLRELLKNKLTKKEGKLVPGSQEQVGSILILEIPQGLEKKEKIIAEAFLQRNKHIKTVVKKFHPHEGVFRLRRVKILAGEKTTQTVHQENGVRLKVDLEKAYFSARLANERLRIAKQIKKPEEVLVMFSGAGAYPLVLARNSPAKLVYGVEINPLAHQLALENVRLNKLENRVYILEGDVRRILPEMNRKFDRILMPLPKTGELFLDVALTKAKPRTVIHFYAFSEEDKIKEEAEKIKELGKRYKHKLKVLRKVVCGQFSPYVVRVCFDLKVEG